MEVINNKNIINLPPQSIPPLIGLGELFYEKMLEHKDALALTDALAGYKQTYEEVFECTVRVATGMRRKGIKPNDIVTICGFNAMDCPIHYYACFFIGAIPANIDPLLSYEDFVLLLKQIKPNWLFVGPEVVRMIKRALHENKFEMKVVALLDEPYLMSAAEFFIKTPQEKDFIPYHVEDINSTAQIVLSSGTTGLPKPICLSHKSLLGHMYQTEPIISTRPKGNSIFYFSNQSYIDYATFTVTQILNGLNHVIYPTYEQEANVWYFIEEYKIGLMALNPHQLRGICETGRPIHADTSTLSLITITGDRVTLEEMQHFRSCFPNTTVINTYGEAELCGTVLSFRPDLHPDHNRFMIEKPLSVGTPLPGYTYKIIDLKTKEVLGSNQQGELLVKSEYFMSSFYNPSDSLTSNISDEFMSTGDVAYYDGDYCFFIVDRKINILRQQTFPTKIENIFFRHPSVHNCVVTNRILPEESDVLLGLVVLKKLAVGTVTEEELTKFVDDQIDVGEKLNGGVRFVQEIPVTIATKTDRKKIKDFLENGQI